MLTTLQFQDTQLCSWMASLTQWTWIWANSRREWKTGKPGVLQSMGWQRAGHNSATKQQQPTLLLEAMRAAKSGWSENATCTHSRVTDPPGPRLAVRCMGAQGKGHGPAQTSSPPHRKLRNIRIRADGENIHPSLYKMKESKLQSLH